MKPDFIGIYRMQPATDIIRSVPLNVDCVDNIESRITMKDLRELFNGAEQVISITDIPWRTRRILLP